MRQLLSFDFFRLLLNSFLCRASSFFHIVHAPSERNLLTAEIFSKAQQRSSVAAAELQDTGRLMAGNSSLAA